MKNVYVTMKNHDLTMKHGDLIMTRLIWHYMSSAKTNGDLQELRFSQQKCCYNVNTHGILWEMMGIGDSLRRYWNDDRGIIPKPLGVILSHPKYGHSPTWKWVYHGLSDLVLPNIVTYDWVFWAHIWFGFAQRSEIYTRIMKWRAFQVINHRDCHLHIMLSWLFFLYSCFQLANYCGHPLSLQGTSSSQSQRRKPWLP